MELSATDANICHEDEQSTYQLGFWANFDFFFFKFQPFKGQIKFFLKTSDKKTEFGRSFGDRIIAVSKSHPQFSVLLCYTIIMIFLSLLCDF